MIDLLPELDDPRTRRRVDLLGAQLRLLSDLTGKDVLLESCDGEIVGYSLGSPVSNTICNAVLTRSARPLRAAFRDSRKVALSTSGPVRTAAVDGQNATVVPVAGGDGPGRLWLLGADVTDLDAGLQALIDELGGLVARLSQVQDINVSDVIGGVQTLPTGLAAGGTFLLVARANLPAGVAVETLRHAARHSSHRPLLYAGVHQHTDVALICGTKPLTVDAVAAMVSDWAAPHGIRCVLTHWEGDGAAVFRQARAALRAAPTGCSVLSQLRSRLFVELISEAADQLDLPGEDPVAGLIDSQPDFARAALAWLDSHGDIAAAAQALTCHVNTLRYRVRRAGELLPGDLRDPDFRLEVHLRLIGALHDGGRP
jgi:hypothetical protein